ncbi:MAG: hemerythrin domain-containing protein [Armatimonadota bacterium]|nr:hemerythrin domain-containing protein [Armatimonadota bacterium]MDR7532268.1 hemerythrin domain-containing protein [Armatimonadota bacterium]
MSRAKATLLEAYRSEHTDLSAGLEALTQMLDRLRDGRPAPGAVGETERFFRRVMIPHAEWEELTFYPAAGELLREHGDVNAAMVMDHREIASRVSDLLALLQRIEAGDCDPALVDRARILGYQIRALVEVHCRKEEEIYCSLLHRYLSDRDVVHALAVGDQLGHD